LQKLQPTKKKNLPHAVVNIGISRLKIMKLLRNKDEAVVLETRIKDSKIHTLKKMGTWPKQDETIQKHQVSSLLV
jgi:hypothetical protein